MTRKHKYSKDNEKDEYDKVFNHIFNALDNWFNSGSKDPFSVSYEYGTGMDQPDIKVNGKPVDIKKGISTPEYRINDPLVDVFEDEESSIISVIIELPGIEKDCIILYQSDEGGNECLEIEVYKTKEHKKEDLLLHKIISIYKKFDSTNIKTSLRNGILEIKLPLIEKKKEVIPIE